MNLENFYSAAQNLNADQKIQVGDYLYLTRVDYIAGGPKLWTRIHGTITDITENAVEVIMPESGVKILVSKTAFYDLRDETIDFETRHLKKIKFWSGMLHAAS